jgi:hypothetical protein
LTHIQNPQCIGALSGAAKALIVSADSVLSLFAFQAVILQGSADRFKTITVVDHRQSSSARNQSEKL